jgi:hypothetical protein
LSSCSSSSRLRARASALVRHLPVRRTPVLNGHVGAAAAIGSFADCAALWSGHGGGVGGVGSDRSQLLQLAHHGAALGGRSHRGSGGPPTGSRSGLHQAVAWVAAPSARSRARAQTREHRAVVEAQGPARWAR